MKKTNFKMKRILAWTFSIILLLLIVLIWWKYYFVFGSGVKTGYLNYVVEKGDLFKTYEGKLIQEGFRSKTAGSIQSYEFEFSVVNQQVAEKLMVNSGKVFDLHYKEYHGVIPWRGNTRYVVDSIIAMREDHR